MYLQGGDLADGFYSNFNFELNATFLLIFNYNLRFESPLLSCIGAGKITQGHIRKGQWAFIIMPQMYRTPKSQNYAPLGMFARFFSGAFHFTC